MRVNFTRFEKSEDVVKFLERYLLIGSATLDDVFAFLKEVGVNRASLVDNTQEADTPDHSDYEVTLVGWAHARPTMRFLSNIWRISFQFNDQRLAKIEVALFSDGLLFLADR